MKTYCFKSSASLKSCSQVNVCLFSSNWSPIACWIRIDSSIAFNALVLISELGLACMASFVSWCLFVFTSSPSMVFDVGSCNGGSSFYSCLIMSLNDFLSLFFFLLVCNNLVSFYFLFLEGVDYGDLTSSSYGQHHVNCYIIFCWLGVCVLIFKHL